MGAAAAVLRRGTRGLQIIALARPIRNRLLRAGATAVAPCTAVARRTRFAAALERVPPAIEAPTDAPGAPVSAENPGPRKTLYR
jgi:hypothetical protein